MKKTLYLIFVLLLILSFILAEMSSLIELEKGKNMINFNFEPIYAKDLLEQNPDLTLVSYFDTEKNCSIGYINVFGGIGNNFILYSNKTYEIIAKNKTFIYLK